MKTSNVELLMGQDLGIAHSYYKPLESELLEDYLKAIDNHTILDDSKNARRNKIKEEGVKDLEVKYKIPFDY